jgi:hypothetical protein
MRVQEYGDYKRMTADGTIVGRGGVILSFICEVEGTLTITEGIIAGGTTIISALPVVAGAVYPLCIKCPLGAYADLTTATGTFVV